MTTPSDVTRLLGRMRAGESDAGEEIYQLLRSELHRLAEREMQRQAPGHSLQPTALVNEVWIRLVGRDGRAYDNREHFLAVAARAMRSVLVDHARSKKALRRGGGAQRLELDSVVAAYEERALDLLELDDALQALGAVDERLAKIVELRFFGGLENQEVAQVLGSSTRTVERGWRSARAWLRERMGPVENAAEDESGAPEGGSDVGS